MTDSKTLQYPDFWRNMELNSKYVATLPIWVKGLPQNLRTEKQGEEQ